MSEYTGHDPAGREEILEAKEQACLEVMQNNPVIKKYFKIPQNIQEYREFLRSLKKIEGSERYLMSDLLLGEGGVSEVWVGFDNQTGRPVAVKKIQFSAFTNIIKREIILSSQINHHNICQIFDAVEKDGEYYIVEELLVGDSLLKGANKDGGGLSFEDIVDIARQISETLQYMHKKGILLNDLKPDNIFLVPDPDRPGRDLVKIIDFGSAASRYEMSEEEPSVDDPEGKKIYELLEDVRKRNHAVTLGYCSPEQINVGMGGNSSVDEKSDLFGLGSVIYFMIKRRKPFKTKNEKTSLSAIEDQIITKHYNAGRLSEDPSVNPKLSALVEQLLEPNPNKRPKSAKEVTQRLREMI